MVAGVAVVVVLVVVVVVVVQGVDAAGFPNLVAGVELDQRSYPLLGGRGHALPH